MALLHEALEDKKFDIRLIEKNLSRGVLKEEELQKFVHALPDDTNNAQLVDIEELKSTVYTNGASG